MRKLAVPAALLLAGCTVGPNYVAPKLAVPAAYEEIPAQAADAPLRPTSAEADLSQWWTQFGDAELESLIGRALASNPDLLAAASRVAEAREQEIVAGAAGLPQVNANGLAARVHSNSNLASKLGGGGAPSSTPMAGGTDITLYSAGFDATWEADIFGGVRRGVEAAKANTDASLWQMRDGEVTLTAEIAADYFTLRATQAEIAILKDEAGRQQDLLGLVTARRAAGFVTELDVNQQNALAASTSAQIPALEAEARVMEHAIAVLLAEPPGALTDELERPAPLPPVPSALPVGLPSDLLRRRPDVREAERKLAAATANIGVAVADLYPKFDLIGAVSFSGSRLGDLLSTGNLGEVGLGTVIWPIFHGGQIHANIRAKQDEEKQAYYAYQKAVLGAVQNAEDAIVRTVTEERRGGELQHVAATAASSSGIALAQYRAGLTGYESVLSAQDTELSARDQLEQSHQALATDLVSLYKALGGGWQETD